MKATIYATPKSAILGKLKEINMAQQEDYRGPRKEESKVVKREEKFEGTDTEYFKTIYNKSELKDIERQGSHPSAITKPSAEQKAVDTK